MTRRMAAQPPDIVSALQTAFAAVRRGQPAEAARQAQALLRRFPESPDVWEFLGLALKTAGRADEAVAAFERAVAYAPDRPTIRNNYGNALRAAGRAADAVPEYRAALALKPDYLDAQANLGIVLAEQEDDAAALQALNAALALDATHVQARIARAQIFARTQGTEAARAELAQILAERPSEPVALHNLAQLDRDDGKLADAAARLQAAVAAKPGQKQSWLSLGHTLRQSGRCADGIPAFERAVALDPGWSEAHIALNDALWEQGLKDRHLQSYRQAEASGRLTAKLRTDYANLLLQKGDLPNAAEQAARAAREAPRLADAHAIEARALDGLHRLQESFAVFDRALAADPARIDIRGYLADAALRAGDPERARDELERCLAADPADVMSLARWALALRALKDSRYEQVADHARLARVYEVPAPEGFTRDGFFAALQERLQNLHGSANAPLYQSVKGGTQTVGDLFSHDDPLIQALQRSFRALIADYAASLPADALPAFVARRARDVEFQGSWSVKLACNGFHTNHVHPKGWISSAFYLQLPRTVQDDAAKEGWFTLGQSNLMLGETDAPGRFIKPEVGALVIFPSFFWHGTVPFTTDETRLTVAFDAAPAR